MPGVLQASFERAERRSGAFPRPDYPDGRDSDDFDHEIDHGLLEPTSYTRSGAQVGFKFWSNVHQFAGTTINVSADRTFTYRNGACAP